MKLIKYFIASSINEFREQRQELGNFFHSLNNILVKRGIYLEMDMCENMSNALVENGLQETYNQKIRECHLFYILVGKEIGKYTIEEFEVALDCYQSIGTPNIYTFFLQIPREERHQSALDFMNYLSKSIKHYYSIFTVIDSVKLNILVELTRIDEYSTLRFEDGQAILNNRAVLSLRNVPLYSNNDAVQALITRRRTLEEEYATLVAVSNNEVIERMKLENSVNRNQITEELHVLEMDVLKLYADISERQQSGRPLTWREIKASRLLETGDYQGALSILRDETRQQELHHAEDIVGNGLSRISGYIRENRMRIQTLVAQGVSTGNLPEIFKCYEESVALAEKYQIEMSVSYDYVSFLEDQHDYPKAISLGERLEKYYEYTQAEPEIRAKLKNVIGICCWEGNLYDKGEKYFRASLEIYCELSSNSPGKYDFFEAMARNNLAILLKNMNRFEEAEKFYREALAMRHRLAEENPDAYKSYEAETCNNLAVLLTIKKSFSEANQLCRKALKIRRELAAEKPVVYEPFVATTCYNLAVLLFSMHQYTDSEAYFIEAAFLFKKYADVNPAAYEAFLAWTYNDYAVLLNADNRKIQAEKMHREALSIRKKYAKIDPVAYEPHLADSCYNLAILLKNDRRENEAKPFLQEALLLYQKYPYLQDKANQTLQILQEL